MVLIRKEANVGEKAARAWARDFSSSRGRGTSRRKTRGSSREGLGAERWGCFRCSATAMGGVCCWASWAWPARAWPPRDMEPNWDPNVSSAAKPCGGGGGDGRRARGQ